MHGLGIRVLGVALALALSGCGDGTDADAGSGNDGGGLDAAAADGGGALDAGDTDAASPGDDGGSTDGGATDGGANDAGATDAAVAADAGGCSACFPRAYAFGRDGGFVREQRRSRIEPCAGFIHTRMGFGSGGGTTARCSNDVPACDAPGMVTVGDVNAAFAHPDVVAAFAAAPILYGRDTRPVDGQVFEIEEVGGAIVTVGSDCGSVGPACVAIPPGVAALQALLVRLETERLGESDCDTVFPP